MLSGLIEYFIQKEKAFCVDKDMMYKYVNDLSVLELATWTTVSLSKLNEEKRKCTGF